MIVWHSILVSLILTCSFFSGAAYDEESVLRLNASDKTWLHESYIKGASDLSYEWLAGIVKNNNVQSVTELLPLLPLNLRSNFTLMKDSLSLQQASPENPRVIMFAHDASLVLTFNGSKEQKGFNTIEVMDFHGKGGGTRLFQIDFNRREGLRFSKQNPKMCLECHASFPKPFGRPKPIWSNYSFWTGAYGESDDEVADEGVAHSFRSFQPKMGEQSSHPIYKHLRIKTQYSPLAPYISKASDPVVEGAYRGKERMLINMPNLRLAKILDFRNAESLATHIIKHDNFESSKYRMLFQYYCHFQKGARQARIENTGLDDFDLHLNDFNLNFDERAALYFNGTHQFGSSAIVAHAVASEILKTDEGFKAIYQSKAAADYYQHFGVAQLKESLKGKEIRNYPSFYQFSLAWAEVIRPYSQALPKSSLGQAHTKDTGGVAYQMCQYLEKKAIAESGDPGAERFVRPFFTASSVEKAIRPRTPREVLESCAGCHTDLYEQQIGPYLQFADINSIGAYMQRMQQPGRAEAFISRITKSLRPQIEIMDVPDRGSLATKLAHRKVMPLGRRSLSFKEREGLVEFILGLRTDIDSL